MQFWLLEKPIAYIYIIAICVEKSSCYSFQPGQSIVKVYAAKNLTVIA